MTPVRKKNQLVKISTKILTHRDLSSCISNERRLSYTFDETIIQKMVELLTKSQINFPWDLAVGTNHNEISVTDDVVRDNAVVVANKIYRSEFERNITTKTFIEKLYNSLQNFQDECGNEQNAKSSIVPRVPRKNGKYLRFQINKQKKILSLELEGESSNNIKRDIDTTV